MKKLLLVLSVLMLSTLGFVLVGCSNDSKTLARNLDDTVTNLIYSVSSLDWADTNTLDSISGNIYPEKNIALTQQRNSVPITQSPNYSANQMENAYYLNDLNNTQMNLAQQGAGYGQMANEARIRNGAYNQQTMQMSPNMSGSQAPRVRFSQTTRSSLPEMPENLQNYAQNTAISPQNVKISNITTTNPRISTDCITESTQALKESVSSLIEKRSKVLLTVNSLYGGNIQLDAEKIKAVNAYLNIIKD